MDYEKELIFTMWGSAHWMYEYTHIIDLGLISKVMLLIHKLSMGWNLFANPDGFVPEFYCKQRYGM